MSASDWEEIKKLASDFHRIQLSSSAQKLSERNCIEIVQRLIELGILDVIYTTDGKEYLTHTELSKEILEELAVAGGRINLVDLQEALNVDLQHVEAKVNGLLRSDKSLKLIVGELISKEYFDHLSEEINDRLQQQRLVTLSELAKTYNLPGDILKELLQERLGFLIKGHVDDSGENVFTESYLNRQQSVIRGIFSSIVRPTMVFPLIAKLKVQEKLFYTVLDNLISSGQLCGSTSGGRPYNVTYTPDIYIKFQQDWVTSFFYQNQYLEYEVLARLGISDPEGFVRRKFQNLNLEFLSSCCVKSDLRERIEEEMEEALEAGLWFDVSSLLPSICTEEDSRLMMIVLTKEKTKVAVFGDKYAVGDALLEKIVGHFKPLVLMKAEKTLRENPSILLSRDKVSPPAEEKEDKKEQKKKKSNTKGLAGSQGREVKTKAVKKKYNFHGNSKENEEEEDGYGDGRPGGAEKRLPGGSAFMTAGELCTELSKMYDAPQDLLRMLAIRIEKDFNKMYGEALKVVFLQSASIPSDEQTTSNASNKKKQFAEAADKIINLWRNARLFEKGILHFKDDIQTLLSSHLLKTVCTDIANLVMHIYAAENMVLLPSNHSITTTDRTNVSLAVKDDKTKSLLKKLNVSLNGKNLEDFFPHFEAICGPEFLNIQLKRDKKTDRQLAFNHKQSLAKDLLAETNPALVIHITSILLFQSITQSMLHASGKFVPHIISFLKGHLLPDQHQMLLECQELVIKQMKTSNGSDALDSLIPRIKHLPQSLAKSSSDASAEH